VVFFKHLLRSDVRCVAGAMSVLADDPGMVLHAKYMGVLKISQAATRLLRCFPSRRLCSRWSEALWLSVFACCCDVKDLYCLLLRILEDLNA